MNNLIHWESYVKLGFALLCGVFIGIDRQIKHKPLGIKTMMVICISSCLVTIVSIQSYYKFSGVDHPNMDPMRLAAQVVSGVGFLGAGVIMRRNNDVISGLTSAAMIWAASGLGITIGVGFYMEALVAVILIIISLNMVPTLTKQIGLHKFRRKNVFIKIEVDPECQINEIMQLFERPHSKKRKWFKPEHKIRNVRLKDIDKSRVLIEMMVLSPEENYTTDIYHMIKQVKHVFKVEIEHS